MFLLIYGPCLASYCWDSIGTIWPRLLDQVANDYVLLEAVLLDNCQFVCLCLCVQEWVAFSCNHCGSQPGAQPSKCSGVACELTVNARGSLAMIRIRSLQKLLVFRQCHKVWSDYWTHTKRYKIKVKNTSQMIFKIQALLFLNFLDMHILCFMEVLKLYGISIYPFHSLAKQKGSYRRKARLSPVVESWRSTQVKALFR